MPASPRQPSDTTSLTSSVPTVSMRNLKAILVYIAGAATIVFALNAWADRPLLLLLVVILVALGVRTAT